MDKKDGNFKIRIQNLVRYKSICYYYNVYTKEPSPKEHLVKCINKISIVINILTLKVA